MHGSFVPTSEARPFLMRREKVCICLTRLGWVEARLFEDSRVSVVSATQRKRLGCQITLEEGASVFVVEFPNGRTFRFKLDEGSGLFLHNLGTVIPRYKTKPDFGLLLVL